MTPFVLFFLSLILPHAAANLVQYNATFNVTERLAPPLRFTERTNGLCGQSCQNGPTRWYSTAFKNTLLVTWTKVLANNTWGKSGMISTYLFHPSTGFQAVSHVKLDLCDVDMGSIVTNADGSIIGALCISTNQTEWPNAIDLVETLRYSTCNLTSSYINTCYPIGMRNDWRNGAGRDDQIYLLEWTGGSINTTPNTVVKINRSAGGWNFGHWELSLNNDATMYFVDMKVTANTHEGEVHFGISRTNNYTYVRGLTDGWACGGGHTIYNRMAHNSQFDTWSVMCGIDTNKEMIWHTVGEDKTLSLGTFTNGANTYNQNGGPYNHISLGKDGWLFSALGPIDPNAVSNLSDMRIGIRHLPRNVTAYNANPSAYPWVWINTPPPKVDLINPPRVGNIQLHNFALGGDSSGRSLLGWAPTVRFQGLASEYVVAEISSSGAILGDPLVLTNAAWGEDTLGAYMPGSGCVVYPFGWTSSPGGSYPIDGSSYSQFSDQMHLTAVCPNDTNVPTSTTGQSQVASTSTASSTAATAALTGLSLLTLIFPGRSDMMGYYQFSALLGLVSTPYFPNSLQIYFTGFAWTLGLIKIPSMTGSIDNLNKAGRHLLGVNSDMQLLGIPIKEAFLTVFSLFLIVMGFMLVLVYPLGLTAIKVIEKDPKREQKFSWTIFRKAIGFTMMSVTGLTLAATYQLSLTGQYWFLYFLAVLVYLMIGGLLVYGTIKMRSMGEEVLQKPETKLKYGSFYAVYKLRFKYFFLLSNAQKILSAVFLAALTGFPWAQISMTMVVRVSFIACMAYLAPHEDIMNHRVTLILSVLKILQILATMMIVAGVGAAGFGVFLIFVNVVGIVVMLLGRFRRVHNVIARKFIKTSEAPVVEALEVDTDFTPATTNATTNTTAHQQLRVTQESSGFNASATFTHGGTGESAGVGVI